MKKYLAAAAVALALGGCSTLQNDWSLLTSASVPATSVIVTGNSYDALEGVATAYLNFCKANRSLSVCSNYVSVRKALLPAVRSARVARTNLENFLIQNPTQLGPSGLYSALETAISTLQSVITQYSVTPTGAST